MRRFFTLDLVKMLKSDRSEMSAPFDAGAARQLVNTTINWFEQLPANLNGYVESAEALGERGLQLAKAEAPVVAETAKDVASAIGAARAVSH